MTMEDDSGVSFPAGGYGDFEKELLWDGAAFDFSNFNDDKDLLQQFDLGGLDNISSMQSQTSSASVSEEPDSKDVVIAAASAAGLQRGGLRRAAFSMNDLQALQPSAPPAPMPSFQSSGMPLEPVLEGVQTLITSIPTSMPQHHMPMYSYPMIQPQSTQAMQAAVVQQQQRPHGQLTNLSIEQIEQQLQRTRHATAAGSMQGQPQMMQQQQFYSVVPQLVKTEGFPQGFQQGPQLMMMSGPGQPSTMAPQAPFIAVSEVAKPAGAVGGGGLRRVQSAVELRRPSDDPSESVPSFLQEDSAADDTGVRIGKLTPEERRQKILRYRQKRHERNFKKKIKYVCRKTLADSRPRVRGRFARNDEEGAKPPPASGSESASAEAHAAAVH